MFSVLLLSPLFVSPVFVDASETTLTDSKTVKSIDDFSYYEQSPYFEVEKNELADTTTITISDYNLVQLLREKGYDTSGFNVFSRGNGTTKIVWHGAARYGNVDVYLSRNVLNGMLNVGVGGIAAIVSATVPGIGAALAGVVATNIATHGLFNSGVIYKIRGFRISSIVYQ